MVSYWKTQWLRFVIGCLFMLQALYHMFTVHEVAFVAWAVSSLIYFISADLCWHRDCIKDLEKRIKALETRAITDIDKVSEMFGIASKKHLNLRPLLRHDVFDVFPLKKI